MNGATLSYPASIRFTIACLALVAACTLPAIAQNPGDNLFAGTQVHTVNIRFLYADYWDSLTIYYNQGFEQYIPATVIFDGVQYDSVGVRFKGNSSFTHPNNKKSLRLAFDQFKDLKVDGEKGFHLNNVFGDPTFMREKLHLDFCRDAGITAPRANYARVSLNDTLWGLYTLVEHVDKRLLKNHFGNSGGDMFKAVDGFGPTDSGKVISDFRWLDTSYSAYASYYELKTDGSLTAWPQLTRLIDTLNFSSDPASALPEMINLNSVYQAFACDDIFANLDSYIGSGRNFYVYFNTSTKKMEWIIWDVGLSFGVFSSGVPGMESLSLTRIVSAADRPLWGKILSVPVLRNDYLQTACSLVNTYFSPERLFPKIDSIATLIRPHVIEDPRKMYTYQQFETNIISDINADGGGGTRKPGLKSFITARQINVLSQLTSLGVSCNTAVGEGEPAATGFSLAQNYPNPFNPSTIFSFNLPVAASVKLEVFNCLGARVATVLDEARAAGTHTVAFDASGLPGGTYVYRLVAGTSVQSRSMTLLK